MGVENLEKAKAELPYDPATPLLGMDPGDATSYDRDTGLSIFSMEFYSVIKKNEIIQFVGKWVDLESIINIILNEVTQAQGDEYHVSSLIRGS